ncbi:MAG: SlyX family protein [Prevotella sp.]|jgi:hypothetical protein|nr:SlyX family protein [Prevotella sp.]
MNKERLTVLAEALGISPSKLSKSLGKSEAYIRTMSGAAGSDLIGEILRKYPQVNAYWLILGEGDVFKTNSGVTIGDDNAVSGCNINGGSINNSITIQAPPEGYEKITKPDGTTIVQRIGLAENSQQTASLQEKIAFLQSTIDSLKETVKAQNFTIDLLREKDRSGQQ